MADSKGTIITSSIENYGKQLLGFLKSKVRNVEDAEDILQEVWHQFTNVTNLHDIQNLSSWLYSVARNKVIDSYRKKKPDSIEDFNSLGNDEENSFKELLLIDEDAQPELALFKEMFWTELLKEGLFKGVYGSISFLGSHGPGLSKDLKIAVEL